MAQLYQVKRAEKRILKEVAVLLAGHIDTPGVEKTMTENVSANGARVKTTRQWAPKEQLLIGSSSVRVMSLARVVYCQPLKGGCFAIGVEFLEPTGEWVVNPPVSVGESLRKLEEREKQEHGR